jgi:hypothetical protein
MAAWFQGCGELGPRPDWHARLKWWDWPIVWVTSVLPFHA